MITGTRNALAGYMRIGESVFGSGGSAGSMDRVGHGLRIANDTPKILETARDEEAVQKKKVAENFKTEIARRIAEDDGDNGRTAEEREALVDSVMGVIERIETDFGKEMATETMVEVLKGTADRVNASTLAVSVGKVLREREGLATRIMTGKTSEADTALFRKHFGDLGDDEDVLEMVKKDSEKLKAMVEFLNRRDVNPAVAAGSSGATVNSGAVVHPGSTGEKISHSSFSEALNSYYGEILVKEEDRHAFTDRFEWANVSDVKDMNGEYRSSMYGFDFTMSVSELGREKLDGLVKFLSDEMGDAESAALIANLADTDDIFAAINAVFVAHDPGVNNILAGELQLNPDGSPMLISDDEEHWRELNRVREAEYARLTDPDYETPQFNYDSEYGYGFMDGRDWKIGDVQWDLSNFLSATLLDDVNAVIRDNEAVRERFLEVASKSFQGNADDVPDSFGLIGFPTKYNMGQVSVSYVMGTADTTAAERALQKLKIYMHQGDEDDSQLFKIIIPPIENRTSVKTVDFPGYSELAAQERNNIYEEAISRYAMEKEQKGILLEDTV
ncbi:MAG: hypothetical protein LBQ79_14870 [Deltaproteobacteria bacterium]|jgi:hypothetical protein|nr:hypothetical protein [Deltaproteobacteria bacterium]